MVGNNYCSMHVMITPYVDSSIITVNVTHSLPVTVKACMIHTVVSQVDGTCVNNSLQVISYSHDGTVPPYLTVM